MSFFKHRNLFLILSLLPATIFTAACWSEERLSEPVVEAHQNSNQAGEVRPCGTEPVYRLIPNASRNKNMEAAWKRFISSGQFRLACDSDADFSLDSAEPKTIEDYSIDKQSRSITNWGNWGYPKRVEEDHLAAIVVDTTRADTNRFGLVILSPPRTGKNEYDVNWLYRNHDLSRASVGMASGSVWVADYAPGGKKSLCWIVWNRSRKIFECRETSR
jgi:hypothetical protein